MKKHILFDLDGVIIDPHLTGMAYSDVQEVIPLLARSCRLSLVTAGREEVQRNKLKRSGIAYCFNHVEVVDDLHKKLAKMVSLAALYPEIDARHTIVVDDRVDGMILAAKSLGYVSVLILRPNGKYASMEAKPGQEPDHTIEFLAELVSIVESVNRI